MIQASTLAGCRCLYFAKRVNKGFFIVTGTFAILKRTCECSVFVIDRHVTLTQVAFALEADLTVRGVKVPQPVPNFGKEII